MTNINDMTELAFTATGDVYAVVDTSAGATKKLRAEALGTILTTAYSLTLLNDAANTDILTTLGIDNDVATLVLPSVHTIIYSYAGTILDDTDAEAALKSMQIRKSTFLIDNGDSGVSLKLSLTSDWNGDTIAEEASCPKDTTTGYFSVNLAGTSITIHNAGLSSSVVTPLIAEIISNASATGLTVKSTVAAGLFFTIYNNSTGVAVDITTLVDTGAISIAITYVTDA